MFVIDFMERGYRRYFMVKSQHVNLALHLTRNTFPQIREFLIFDNRSNNMAGNQYFIR